MKMNNTTRSDIGETQLDATIRIAEKKSAAIATMSNDVAIVHADSYSDIEVEKAKTEDSLEVDPVESAPVAHKPPLSPKKEREPTTKKKVEQKKVEQKKEEQKREEREGVSSTRLSRAADMLVRAACEHQTDLIHGDLQHEAAGNIANLLKESMAIREDVNNSLQAINENLEGIQSGNKRLFDVSTILNETTAIGADFQRESSQELAALNKETVALKNDVGMFKMELVANMSALVTAIADLNNKIGEEGNQQRKAASENTNSLMTAISNLNNTIKAEGNKDRLLAAIRKLESSEEGDTAESRYAGLTVYKKNTLVRSSDLLRYILLTFLDENGYYMDGYTTAQVHGEAAEEESKKDFREKLKTAIRDLTGTLPTVEQSGVDGRWAVWHG